MHRPGEIVEEIIFGGEVIEHGVIRVRVRG